MDAIERNGEAHAMPQLNMPNLELRAITLTIVMLSLSIVGTCMCLAYILYLETAGWSYFCSLDDPRGLLGFEGLVGLVIAAALCAGWISLSRSIRAAKCMPRAITAANIMQNETRQRILALVKASPGIHFSRIKSDLGASPRTIRDQLRTLLSFGYIKNVKIEGRSAYFTSDSGIMNQDGMHPAVHVLVFLQRSRCDALLAALVSNRDCTFSKLVAVVDEPRSTVRRKLRALETRHYVEITRNGQEMISIRLAPNIEEHVSQNYH